MKYTKFEELPIWKEALALTKLVYDLTAKGSFAKDFGLRDQTRRAVVSISSNIVEGFEKNNNNEFIRYLKISKGSIGEVRNHLYIALSVGYITKAEFESTNNRLDKLARDVGALTGYLDAYRKKQKSVIRNIKINNNKTK